MLVFFWISRTVWYFVFELVEPYGILFLFSVYYYCHWVDASVCKLLVLDGIIRPFVSSATLILFIKYDEFPFNIISCNTKKDIYYNGQKKEDKKKIMVVMSIHSTLSNANSLINRGALRCSTIAVLSFHHSWLITRIVTRVTRGVPHMGQDICVHPGVWWDSSFYVICS